jgi:Omp85 superfamily domain
LKRTLIVAALLMAAVAPPGGARAAESDSEPPPPTREERIRMAPVIEDSEPYPDHSFEISHEDVWLRTPFGDDLLTDPAVWASRRGSHFELDRHMAARMRLAYNRVDRVALGLGLEVQDPTTLAPRLGTRLEYATDRERWLYGIQLEQPLAPPGRLALGVSMVRRTDHSELQQVDDTENSLALLLGRVDYRDYFEREGFGTYLSWRVPDFSTVSVHWRNDDYRSLPAYLNTVSWFHTDQSLRDNPPIDDGRTHTVAVRLERLAHRTFRTRAGIYHWIEMEWAGQGLGGDFSYTRALADVRSVLRLTPVSTFAFRMVGGFTPKGVLPRQKEFTLGGVDGLRAQPFARFRGDEMLLGQAEYQVEIGRIAHRSMHGALQAIVFIDAGRAWTSPDHTFDLQNQHLQTDAGFGFAASEDRMRIYFARDLGDRNGKFLVSLRLQRPF